MTVSQKNNSKQMVHSTTRKAPRTQEALRHDAEAMLSEKLPPSPQELALMSPEAIRLMMHDLHVHQVELEMQNEELRTLQHALDISLARYFDLYDLAPVGYCTLSELGFILQANLSAATLVGETRSKLIGLPFARFVCNEDADAYHLYLKQVAKADQPQSCELRMRAGGNSIWVRLVTTVGSDDKGMTVLRVVINDIDDRKQSEAALREEKEFFHLIAENIGDFIAVLDPQGRRLYNSPSYLRIFGPTNDLRGSDCFAEIHPEDCERIKTIFQETVRTGLGRQTHYRFVTADGNVREMESVGSVIKDNKNQVTRVVVVSRDITERKKIEDQVRQLAFHDTLTQLPNRRLLADRLTQAMSASVRSGLFGAVMFLDLDNFKKLNDTQGHGVGDLLLLQVADRLKNCVREMDTVARFGGDEFVVIMISELDSDKAESMLQAGLIAEKIRTTLSDFYLLTITQDGQPDKSIVHHCTASIGIALFAGHQASQSDLLKWADTAMYRAKAAGRNSILFMNQ